jgi:DNA repair ATPase RecN
MQLLYNLAKQYDYERYICALFMPQKIRDKLITVTALCGEISKIPQITSEEMVALVRLKWWVEHLENLNNNQSTSPILQSARMALCNDLILSQELINFCEIVSENCQLNAISSIQKIMHQYFKLLSIAADESDYSKDYANIADYFSEIAFIRSNKTQPTTPVPALPQIHMKQAKYLRKLYEIAKMWNKQLTRRPDNPKINHLAYKLLLQSFTFYLPK